MRHGLLTAAILVSCILPLSLQAEPFVESGERVVFIGDSNTYAGGFISDIECHWQSQFPHQPVEFINVGLPSETACGLSEPAHPFPRPTAQERIDRVLEKLEPDVLVIGYGMNDGIYAPFDERRFAAYQAGISTLVAKGKAAGARVVLLTPPPFDPLPLRKRGKLRDKDAGEFSWTNIYENYDQVMARYAEWIRSQSDQVDIVVDVRTPFVEFMTEQREADPDYAMSKDGVHFDQDGHAVISRAILNAWQIPEVSLSASERERVSKTQQVIRDSAVSYVGHKRPNVKPGIPWDEALKRLGRQRTN